MFEITHATVSDLPEVTEAFARTLDELAPLGHEILPTARNISLFSEKEFAPALASGEHGIFLARRDTVCVGAVISVQERDYIDWPAKRAVCYAEWVAPDCRKRGLATELLKRSNEYLKSIGFREVVSHVLPENTASFALCRKAGAKVKSFRISFPL